jgi:NAD(P)-dependent dehydrogenase (short-subunit alcohol dehydrogenase family)
MSRIRLAEASIAVTGAARGIGYQTARLLKEAGASVAIGDIDKPAVNEAAAELGHDVLGLPLDVSDRKSFASFLDAAEQRNGPLDALVSNAGLMPVGRFLDMDPQVVERTIAVNVTGTAHALSLALPGMIERGRGRVVIVASLMGRLTAPGVAIYGASKHATVALAQSVRDELRGSGVEIVTVLPSMVRTELSAGIQGGRGMPVVEPEEVARAIVKACEHGGGEVAVPRWLNPVTRVGAGLPPALMRPLRWALRDDRALTGADREARESYEERIRRTK